MDVMLGICCSCQSAHPVSSMPASMKRMIMEWHDYTEGTYETDHGEAGNYVMAPHRIFENDTGPECSEGVGTMPQTVFKKK